MTILPEGALAPLLSTTCRLATFLLLAVPLAGCATTRPRPPVAPGAYVADCPSTPNCVSTAAPPSDPVHWAAPLPFTGDPDAAKARMRAIVDGMERTKLVEETPTSLHYTFTSRLMRFVDDVDFVFVPDALGAGGVVHFRSASRVGHGDMGVNRARTNAIAAAWAGGQPPR
jgi:uncharacterized protein (DUF1499 family)